MKRVLTKIAGIIDTVLYGLLAAGCSLSFGLILSGSALIAEIKGEANLNFSNIFIAVLVIVVFAIAICGLVFSIKSISFSRDSIEEYRNRYPIIITNIVFNSMFAVLLIMFIGVPSLFIVSIFGCFIACGILYTVDMAKNTILLEQKESVLNIEAKLETDDYSSDLEGQLKKLNELKEQNLITEKEYTALREKLIKQEIEKD